MAAPAKPLRAREGPGLRRAKRETTALERGDAERADLRNLVDAVAVLAADLWFAGRLDAFPASEAADDDEE